MMSLDGFFNFDTIKSNTIKNYEVKKNYTEENIQK